MSQSNTDPSCNTTNELKASIEFPIPVTTCLNSTKNEIECCITPFSFYEVTSECIWLCFDPEYFDYPKNKVIKVEIIYFIILWIDTIVVFLCLMPVLFTPSLRRWPR
jgi:hypothetical protein